MTIAIDPKGRFGKELIKQLYPSASIAMMTVVTISIVISVVFALVSPWIGGFAAFYFGFKFGTTVAIRRKRAKNIKVIAMAGDVLRPVFVMFSYPEGDYEKELTEKLESINLYKLSNNSDLGCLFPGIFIDIKGGDSKFQKFMNRIFKFLSYPEDFIVLETQFYENDPDLSYNSAYFKLQNYIMKGEK